MNVSIENILFIVKVWGGRQLFTKQVYTVDMTVEWICNNVIVFRKSVYTELGDGYEKSTWINRVMLNKINKY